ncbi:MAG: acetyl-CoA carboxylase, carboxyltransferase subunit beta [candidate division WOR-3 bacterium]|nr:acetyl-CoA carboxylase, carboxyltransferase subunit beta [candidate division WOR-3 bacterium]MDH5684832.1 acetyl-CoA carboxylase, carboxyltransferase subunit beta [candidate division WOR-3 bacterium]
MRSEKKPARKMEIPDGLWQRCDSCNEILYRKTLEKNFFICPRCNFHFRISSRKYIELLLDQGKIEEFDADLMPGNPLGFPNYETRIKETQTKTSLKEGFIYGKGKIGEKAVVLGVMDFNFIGGSMGSVVGEKVAQSIRLARKERIPLIIISTSGGARMQEGIYSLMQMAKTSAELALLDKARIPYLSIVTNPTFAGVMASYASLGDIIIAEPGALLGFTGPRVIEQTIGEKLPQGFQRSDFLLKHGFVDMVISRKDLKDTISKILDIIWSKSSQEQ